MSGEPLLLVPGATVYQVEDASHAVAEIANGNFTIGYATGSTDVLLAQVGPVRWPLGPSTATLRFDDLTYSFQLPYNQYDERRTAASPAPTTYYYCLTLQPDTPHELIDLLQAVLASGSAYHDQQHVTLQPTPPPSAPAPAPATATAAAAAAGTAAAANTTADLLAAGLQRGGQLAAAGVLAAAAWSGAALVRGAEVAVARMQPAERQAEVSAEAQARLERARLVAGKAAEVSGRAVGAALNVTAHVAASLAQRFAASDLGQRMKGSRVAGASAQDLRKVGAAGVEAVEAVYDSLSEAARLVLSHSHAATTRVVGHKYGEEAAQATRAGFQAAQGAVEAGLNVYKLRPTALANKVLRGTATNVVLGREGQPVPRQGQAQQQAQAGSSTAAAQVPAAAVAQVPAAAAAARAGGSSAGGAAVVASAGGALTAAGVSAVAANAATAAASMLATLASNVALAAQRLQQQQQQQQQRLREQQQQQQQQQQLSGSAGSSDAGTSTTTAAAAAGAGARTGGVMPVVVDGVVVTGPVPAHPVGMAGSSAGAVAAAAGSYGTTGAAGGGSAVQMPYPGGGSGRSGSAAAANPLPPPGYYPAIPRV